MKQTLIVRAVIKQGDKVLLLRRATGNPAYIGMYELPGGKVDFGEDPRAALQREISEEIGREAQSLQLFDVHSELDVRDLKHQYIELVFWVTLKPDTAIELGSEHDKYVWKKIDQLKLNDVTETTRLALQLRDSFQPGARDSLPAIANDVNGTTDLIIYADGGSRGNPGPSAAGFVIYNSKNKIIFKGGNYLGITTNNQAEYQAVKLAIEKALSLEPRPKHLSFRLDSQLVTNQLNGVYQIRNRDLWPIHSSIKDLIQKFEKVDFTHIMRALNKEADAMVNKVLDDHQKGS